jgi:hypothetical protein
MLTLLHIAIALVDLTGWLLGAAVLWRAPGASTARLRRELLVLGAFGIGYAVVTGATTIVVFRNVFAVFRIWSHVLFWVLAPLALARGAILLRRRRGSAAGAATLVALGLSLAGVHVYATAVEPFRLEVRRHRVPVDAELVEPVRIAILADLQTDRIGAFEQVVFARLDAERPDLVLLPGDWLQVPDESSFAREQPRLAALFEGLGHSPRLGIWAVDGDIETAARELAGTPARVLHDEIVPLPGEPALQVIGLSRPASRRPLDSHIRAAIDSFAGFSIVFGHAPDFALPAIDGRDRPRALLVAGHTHGGQVVIPGFGPPFTLTSIPRTFAAGGLFELGATTLCVSRGVGMERGYAPRVRFLCRPELVVIELVPRGR